MTRTPGRRVRAHHPSHSQALFLLSHSETGQARQRGLGRFFRAPARATVARAHR